MPRWHCWPRQPAIGACPGQRSSLLRPDRKARWTATIQLSRPPPRATRRHRHLVPLPAQQPANQPPHLQPQRPGQRRLRPSGQLQSSSRARFKAQLPGLRSSLRPLLLHCRAKRRPAFPAQRRCQLTLPLHLPLRFRQSPNQPPRPDGTGRGSPVPRRCWLRCSRHCGGGGARFRRLRRSRLNAQSCPSRRPRLPPWRLHLQQPH